MNWQEACEHTSLQNLPFKIELDERGKIIMTPVKVNHSAYQGEISYLLRSMLKQGRTLPECAVGTRRGTKVADTAWASRERFMRIVHETECSVAPEICVEVISPSSTEGEINEKKELYFENGAEEVWICTNDGDMNFYMAGKEIRRSVLAPEFPKKIELEF
ncbi:MAG: Uma2 family endonuclease [Deltaproteobacteria bacterium]|nr:MAG: Uma2 family endonuclease [Deltaproteobacteria bacterium]